MTPKLKGILLGDAIEYEHYALASCVTNRASVPLRPTNV